jgi:hypothetical protein
MTDKQGIVRGKWISGKNQIKVNLSLIAFEEDNCQIVFCPALDISGYGKSEKEALESFNISLGEFFHYTINKDTFINELKELGWTIKKSKSKPMTPPPMSRLLETNNNFSRIFNDHAFRKFDKAIEMPLA